MEYYHLAISVYISVSSVVFVCVDRVDEHLLLLGALEEGMMTDEYAFVILNHLPPPDLNQPWVTGTTETIPLLRQAYRYTVQVINSTYVRQDWSSSKHLSLRS